MGQVTHPADLTTIFAGAVTLTTVNLPNSCVTNADIEAGADIDASKLEQHHVKTISQSGASASATQVIHYCRGAGIFTGAWGGALGLCVGATASITIDFKKNGTSILSAVISIAVADGTACEKQGSITTTTFVAGDLITVVITVTATGTDVAATGVWAQIQLDEAYIAA